MSDFVGLDFETYGAEDLPTHGAYRYMHDPSFQSLIAGGVRKDTRGFKEKYRFDFIMGDRATETSNLGRFIGSSYIVAHNAQFEQGVLRWMGLDYPTSRFIDSAVVARACGAGSKLEAAAPQLLGVDKMAEGWDLIKLFSLPGSYQEQNGNRMFDKQVVTDNPDKWSLFMDYCVLDAELGLDIVDMYLQWLTAYELEYSHVTFDMNDRGWHVDVPLVEEMLRRSNENKETAEHDFRTRYNAPDLNLGSHKQMMEWCEQRGIKARSFAEKPLEKLRKQIETRLQDPGLSDLKRQDYTEVHAALVTKQIIGGSSLKKLPTILDMTGADSQLRGQYLHVGAGQTWRTTGKGVQLQNLKRLGEPSDMSELDDPDSDWDNDELARNIRQTFTATDPQGFLIVGDLSSVESRGLAWLGQEAWKLNAYRDGVEVYKLQAARMKNVTIDQVDKEMRQLGKVGELSCGYQAGPPAVKDFAEKMGTLLSEAESTKLVFDWRDANPKTVQFWYDLDAMLHEVIEDGNIAARHVIGNTGWAVKVTHWRTPESLLKQHPGAQSLCLELTKPNSEVFVRRFFHGCHMRGRNIGYYKPSELKSGDLWKNFYTNPKTKRIEFYQLYGGKLAGILTQSMCREIFMGIMAQVEAWTRHVDNLSLIGQFHDELVLDWKPRRPKQDGNWLDLYNTEAEMYRIMCGQRSVVPPGMPMNAEIKFDYRYTK